MWLHKTREHQFLANADALTQIACNTFFSSPTVQRRKRLDFDATDIPKPLVSSFTEAIACHSVECYIASALMIRRTLEELCKDRGATGKNLKERLASLGTKVVLPTELLEALDHLRLLGNDAAHIESQEYDKVGKPEVEIAIEFTKEVLKAVYQYSGLLGKLKGLKKSPTP